MCTEDGYYKKQLVSIFCLGGGNLSEGSGGNVVTYPVRLPYNVINKYSISSYICHVYKIIQVRSG